MQSHHYCRLIAPSTAMDQLVEGQETEAQQQLSLEDPQSSVKWLPLSKPKEEHPPTPTRRKQLSWNQHYLEHSSMLIIFQTQYSCTQTANHYVKLSFHQILVPLPSRLSSSFNGSLAILPFLVMNQPTTQREKLPPLPPTQSFLL